MPDSKSRCVFVYGKAVMRLLGVALFSSSLTNEQGRVAPQSTPVR